MRGFTIGEMIARLEEYAEMYGENTEVRMATQPNWPFEWAIDGMVASDEIPSEDGDKDEDEDEDSDGPDGEPTVIYILEGTQLGYASKRLWDEF